MTPAKQKGPVPSVTNPQPRPKIVLLGSSGERIRKTIANLRPLIEQHAEIVLTDLHHEQDLSQVEADLAFVFGGDGTILRSAQQMGDHQLPVLGVNLGKLGFLADLSVEKLREKIASICAGEYRVIEHLMLVCEVKREQETICRRVCLNEVAVLGGPPYSIMEIDLYVDSTWVTTYSCDGLIISTPVGSTAHSLSAGGPILRKDLQAVVISPISPHTLTVRPVVESAQCQFEMCVHRRDGPIEEDQTAVVLDGVVLHVLGPKDRVLVSRAEPTFRLVQVAGHGYYRTLREKLGWGGGIRRAQGN